MIQEIILFQFTDCEPVNLGAGLGPIVSDSWETEATELLGPKNSRPLWLAYNIML